VTAPELQRVGLNFYIIFISTLSLFIPFIHPRKYSSVSTTKEVHMDITYLSLAVTLAAITIALVYAISRNTGRT
jgi:hypothetical protein